MATLIRELRSSDLSGWETLWRGYQRHYEADLSADEERLWRDLMTPGSDGPFALVAENGVGELVGLAQYLFHLTTWSPRPRCYLNDLYTVSSARRQGVATQLIERVEEIAKAHGAGQVWWLTQEFNHSARSLYDKLAERTPFVKYVR
jgi:GNAT superfamily N-acetyltransferase